MKQFGELFMPPASPGREMDPQESVLNQIRCLDDDRHGVRAQLFMNQLHDVEAGIIP